MDIILHFPDTPGYLAYAHNILTHAQWLITADINVFLDPTLHRLPLYPLLLAFCMKLSESYWSCLVVFIQLCLLMYSLFCLLNLSQRLNFSKIAKMLFVVSYLSGLPLICAFSILTDSLFLSLTIIALSNVGVFILEGKKNKYLAVTLISLILAGLLRETGLYAALFVIPFVGLTWKRNREEALILLKVVIVSALLPVFLLQTWNFVRCGNAVVSTGLVTALTPHEIDLINLRYPKETKSALSAYLPKKVDLSFGDALTALHSKMKAENKNIIELQKEEKASYQNLFFQYPTETIVLFIKRLNRDMLLVGFNPFNTFQEWKTALGHKVTHLSDLRQGSAVTVSFAELLHIIMVNFMRLISLMISAFGFYKIYLFTKSRATPEKTVVLGLAFHSILLILIYALAHLEIRYVASSIAIINFLAFVKTSQPTKKESIID